MSPYTSTLRASSTGTHWQAPKSTRKLGSRLPGTRPEFEKTTCSFTYGEIHEFGPCTKQAGAQPENATDPKTRKLTVPNLCPDLPFLGVLIFLGQKSFLTKEIPWCFECFRLFFSVFLVVLLGSRGVKNPWCFVWFSLVSA